MFEDKPKATKTHLKRVRALKAEIIRMLNSETKSKLKSSNDPPIAGEIPVGRYPNLVIVPTTDKDREMLRRRLKEVEEEERRVEAELTARTKATPKSTASAHSTSKSKRR